MEIYAGSDADKVVQRQLYEYDAIKLGLAKREFYLSGGSEIRRDQIAHWKEYADNNELICKVTGNCKVEIYASVYPHATNV